MAAHGAMQSQDYEPAKWAIAQRTKRVTSEELDRAVAQGRIVRTHILRPTWHFVARDDLRWMMALTGPRVQRGAETRYAQLGLDTKRRARAEKVIGEALAGTRLTRREIGEALRKSRVEVEGQRLPWLIGHCEYELLICSGGPRGKEQTYALVDELVPPLKSFDPDEAAVELFLRYLGTHGPATLVDFRWWSSLKAGDVRRAVEGCGDRITSHSVDGLELWALSETAATGRSRQGARFLQTYDEFVVGYTQSRFLGDPRADEARASFMRGRWPSELVLRADRITGHWKRRAANDHLDVEVFVYEDLGLRGEQEIEREAKALAEWMGLEPRLKIGRVRG